MIVCSRVNLYNFRCYDNENFEFSENINILVGDNAVGKTSIVESIFALGTLKSHKATDDKEMIKKNAEFSIIKGFFNKNNKNDEIKFLLNQNGKRIFSNEKEFSKLSEHLGYYTPIIFCPEDLDIIKGGPAERRKFIDSNLSLIDNSYLKSLIRFKKILKQRNEILKNMFENNKYNHDILAVYTEGFADVSKAIIKTRSEFVDRINPYLKEKSLAISNGSEVVQLEYLKNVETNQVIKRLNERVSLDIQAKTTTIGPHRDDLLVTINGEAAKIYASQGQQRSSVLSLKLGLSELIKVLGGEVIIILDDVFSELDLNRQNEILSLIDNDIQIFITTTSIANLSEEIIRKSNVIRLTK